MCGQDCVYVWICVSMSVPEHVSVCVLSTHTNVSIWTLQCMETPCQSIHDHGLEELNHGCTGIRQYPDHGLKDKGQ